MELNAYIDHTLLKPDAQKEQIEKLCLEAIQHQFASVCVNGYWVPLCKELLKNTPVAVCTVVGFPLGAVSHEVKAFETMKAVRDGADEIDMVMNVGALKAGDVQTVYHEICEIIEKAQGRCVKVILETCLLTEAEIRLACDLCVKAKALYVKTSTGFSSGGARVEDIRIMQEAVHGHCKIKASGGIRTYEDMLNMINAGANRIGTSAGVSIMEHK